MSTRPDSMKSRSSSVNDPVRVEGCSCGVPCTLVAAPEPTARLMPGKVLVVAQKARRPQSRASDAVVQDVVAAAASDGDADGAAGPGARLVEVAGVTVQPSPAPVAVTFTPAFVKLNSCSRRSCCSVGRADRAA